jgi:hypothetical protein
MMLDCVNTNRHGDDHHHQAHLLNYCFIGACDQRSRLCRAALASAASKRLFTLV